MAEISLADRPEVQEKLRRRIESAKVKVGVTTGDLVRVGGLGMGACAGG